MTLTRGQVVETASNDVERFVVAYTIHAHPAGPRAVCLPADPSNARGWHHLDMDGVRLSDDQRVDWSGPAGELRQEAFNGVTSPPPIPEHVQRWAECVLLYEALMDALWNGTGGR